MPFKEKVFSSEEFVAATVADRPRLRKTDFDELSMSGAT